jgi:sugar transferase (PEP-CTERM/EpsH1 system associated)
MRILFITDTLPYPAITGAPLRSYNILRRLAHKNRVWLVAFAKTSEQREGMTHMQTFCEEVLTDFMPADNVMALSLKGLRYLINGVPPDLRFYYSEILIDKIRHLAAKVNFDVVHIDHTHMGIYLRAMPMTLRQRSVWMLHDVDFCKFERIANLETRLARRLRLKLHSRMLYHWQPRHAENFARSVTVSDFDRRLLLRANPHLQIDVAPNGIDTKLFRPLPCNARAPALIFVGNMDYLPCVDAVLYFCRDALPRIRNVIKDIEMWIVGINPRHEVKQLAGNGVYVTGKVDDVQPFYERSTACVVPLRAGGGTRLKILEAMALGRPVISTSIGCEGLELKKGQHLLLAETAEQFAEKTIQLLTDVSLQQRLIQNGRELVVKRYDWDVIAEKMLEIYAVAAGESGANMSPIIYPEDTL